MLESTAQSPTPVAQAARLCETADCSLPPCGGGLGWGGEHSDAATPHPNPPPQGGRALSVTRRSLLKASGLGLFALAAGQGTAANPRPRAKSVIFLHQFGGPSHLDTFDMKPHTPAEIRGIYRPIPS